MALSRFILPFADVGSGIRPSANSQMFFYATGTTTPKDTFNCPDGTTANSNPVVSDINGLFPDIFVTGTYKVVLQDKNGDQQWEADPVASIGTGSDLTYVVTAEFLSATSFKALGDHTSVFVEGARVALGFSDSDPIQSTVISSLLNAGDTEVTIEDAVVTSSVETASISNGIVALNEFIEDGQDAIDTFNAEGDAAIADFEARADDAIYAIGFKNVGVFGIGETVQSSQETLTYNGEEFNTTAGPFPYTTDGATPDADSADWYNVTLEARKTVARSLNVLDSDVIYDTDTVTPIPSYIYSASQQITYSTPVDAQGKFIVSVVGNVLNTNIDGPYTLTVPNPITIQSVNEIALMTFSGIGQKVTWLGYYSASDGGGNWGIIKSGAHTADGGSIFSIDANTYVEANFGRSVGLKMFGAKGDGLTDNTAIINIWINYISETEKCGVITEGDYLQSGTVSLDMIDQNKLIIKAVGSVQWQLNGGVSNSIEITQAGNYWLTNVPPGNNLISFSGITFTTTNEATSIGISILGSCVAGRPTSGIIFDECIFRGNTNQAQTWAYAIKAVDARDIRLQSCDFLLDATNDNGIGFSVSSTAQANSAADHKILNCSFIYGSKGIEVGDYVEGVYITNSNFVGNDYGVYFDPIGIESGLHISNSHLSCNVSNLFLSNCADVNITGCLIFSIDTMISIEGDKLARFAITGNVFKATGATGTAIKILNSIEAEPWGGNISGNSFHSFQERAIWLTLSSEYNHVGDNSYRDCTVRILNQGPNNSITFASYIQSDVFSLTGGTEVEEVSVVVPPGMFTVKPEVVLFSSSTQAYQASYDFSGSTNILLKFLISRYDSGILPAVNVRIGYEAKGL